MTTIQQLADLEATPHANVFPDSEPKTIRLALDTGEQVDPHRHPDREIVFYLIEGGITLHLGEDAVDLSSGDIIRFGGDQDISPVATEDSTALIVLASNQETER